MRTYDVRETCRVLRIKPHVLRYWSQTAALAAPEHDASMRKYWPETRIDALLRLRHFILDKDMSVQEAERRVFRELDGAMALKPVLAELRRELARVLAAAPDLPREAPAGGGQVERESNAAIDLATLVTRGVLPPPPGSGVPTRSRDRGGAAREGGGPVRDAGAAGRGGRPVLLSVTHLVYPAVGGAPPLLVPVGPHGTLLAAAAARLRDQKAVNRFDRWHVAVRERHADAVRAAVADAGSFGFGDGYVHVVPVPDSIPIGSGRVCLPGLWFALWLSGYAGGPQPPQDFVAFPVEQPVSETDASAAVRHVAGDRLAECLRSDERWRRFFHPGVKMADTDTQVWGWIYSIGIEQVLTSLPATGLSQERTAPRTRIRPRRGWNREYELQRGW